MVTRPRLWLKTTSEKGPHLSCVVFTKYDNFESDIATLSFVFADRRATARTTTFVEPCSIQIKKKFETTYKSKRCETGNRPQRVQGLQKRAPVMSKRQSLCQSRRNNMGRRWLGETKSRDWFKVSHVAKKVTFPRNEAGELSKVPRILAKWFRKWQCRRQRSVRSSS